MTELWFNVPLDKKQVISETFPPWYGKILNLTQQKHAFTNQKKCNTTHKTKAKFSRLLRHQAWKRSGSILKGVREAISKKKVKKKDKWRIYDINKQTIYIAPKSKIESKGALWPGTCTGCIKGKSEQLCKQEKSFTAPHPFLIHRLKAAMLHPSAHQ